MRPLFRAQASTGVACFLLLLLSGCSKSGGEAAHGPTTSLGEVMTIVGRRFEVLGRATVANRFELAEFEAGELGELFEDDIPHAELPKEGPTAHVGALAKQFLATEVPALRTAASAKDRRALEAAFAHAASACNGCHQASAKAFIEIPTVAGRSVPSVDPLGAAGDVTH